MRQRTSRSTCSTLPEGMTRVTWVPMNDLSRALTAEQSDLAGVFADVLRSGWLVQGPRHDAFETEFSAYIGAGHVVGVASGTRTLCRDAD